MYLTVTNFRLKFIKGFRREHSWKCNNAVKLTWQLTNSCASLFCSHYSVDNNCRGGAGSHRYPALWYRTGRSRWPRLHGAMVPRGCREATLQVIIRKFFRSYILQNMCRRVSKLSLAQGNSIKNKCASWSTGFLSSICLIKRSLIASPTATLTIMKRLARGIIWI